jgi:hypothetical protein
MSAPAAALPRFSLVRGGPTYRLGLRLGRSRHWPEVRLGIALALMTWLPLLILAAIEGVLFAGTVKVSFMASLSSHVRFLVAMPLLFVAEVWIDPRLASFVAQSVDSGLVPASKRAALDRAMKSAARWRDSVAVEAVILGLAVVLVATGVRVELPAGISTWSAVSTGTGPHLTLAGWWYLAAALPVFQFLLARWFWRLLIWFVFLWRLSRIGLDLVPTHPDLSGGLGYLGVVQSYFSTLGFATSTVFAAQFAEKLVFAGVSLRSLVGPIVGVVLLNLVLVLGPLLVFSPELVVVKRRGLRDYGVLASHYTRAFDIKWLRGAAPPDEPFLGSADIQSLADLGNSVEIIRNMRIVPVAPITVVGLAAVSLAPMLPLLLVSFSVDDLLIHAVKLLLGL